MGWRNELHLSGDFEPEPNGLALRPWQLLLDGTPPHQAPWDPSESTTPNNHPTPTNEISSFTTNKIQDHSQGPNPQPWDVARRGSRNTATSSRRWSRPTARCRSPRCERRHSPASCQGKFHWKVLELHACIETIWWSSNLQNCLSFRSSHVGIKVRRNYLQNLQTNQGWLSSNGFSPSWLRRPRHVARCWRRLRPSDTTRLEDWGSKIFEIFWDISRENSWIWIQSNRYNQKHGWDASTTLLLECPIELAAHLHSNCQAWVAASLHILHSHIRNTCYHVLSTTLDYNLIYVLVAGTNKAKKQPS